MKTENEIAKENMKGCGDTDNEYSHECGSYVQSGMTGDMFYEFCKKCLSKQKEHLTICRRLLDEDKEELEFIDILEERMKEKAILLFGFVARRKAKVLRKIKDKQQTIKTYEDAGIK